MRNKNIPRGIAIGVFIVILVYLSVNTAYLSLLPIEKLREIKANNGIAAIEGSKNVLGKKWRVVYSVANSHYYLRLLSCDHHYKLPCVLCNGKEKLFFIKAGQLNKHAVPGNSLLYQCVWACILVLSGTFDQLTDMIIFAIFIFYGATALGCFYSEKKNARCSHGPYKVWGYPVVPAIVILISVALICQHNY
jgi:APA family basic amino acid/polyamine antiporter